MLQTIFISLMIVTSLEDKSKLINPLYRFIKKTLKTNADAVCRVVDGRPQLLKDVFDELNINPYDLSVDLLDCHADSNVYHRLDFLLVSNFW